ncbi:MAG: TonB family protein [Bacteroidales bacterium]|nr:TonB family protein [Bacteroidales bacterium]
MTDEYSEMFLNYKEIITDGINSLKLPQSFFPVDVLVSYENGEGLVTLSANYVHDDIFSQDSRYSSVNNNRRVFAEGITFILPKILATILKDYKFNVASKGGHSINIDSDILNFKSCVILNSGQNYVQIYAYDEYKSTSSRNYKSYFYPNIFLKYNDVTYEIEPQNVSTFNSYDFFYIGKTTGFDGKPTPYYYFSKFFKIDEWKHPSHKTKKSVVETKSQESIVSPDKKLEDKSDDLEIIFKIINSSTYFKNLTNGLSERIIENGGTSYGFIVAKKPSDEKDKTQKIYEISLHETYPDRIVTITRFIFDIQLEKLFVNNIIDTTQIDFNKDLLKLLREKSQNKKSNKKENKNTFLIDILQTKSDSLYIDFENLESSYLPDCVKINKNKNDSTLFTLSSYFENGKIFRKYTDISLIDSSHVKFEEWHKNGQLKETNHFNNNNTLKQRETFWKNGKIKRKDIYENGKLINGITWDSKGNEVKYYPYEIPPSFPGGDIELRKIIANNIKYPIKAAENEIQGRVWVGFIVEKDGSIIDVEVLRGIHPLLDKEAIEVVEKLPAWTPGQKDGENIRFSYIIPINFSLK